MIERKMRRFRQELPVEETKRILTNGKFAVLAVDGDDGYPYAVPLNYVYADNAIFIHSAAAGHEADSV
ncbi:MAG: pyridoxamine 5'-phosphate oxidase family protein, partial [Bacteroidales bacterium]|nr:pyridoxamine 5'-phosphate oxidase family protein [Bacteroidales bacterium]